MKILTICDSFKGTLSSKEIGIIVSNELNNKGHIADYVSISDGGEGFIDSFSEILNVLPKKLITQGPLPHQKVTAKYLVKEQTGFVELAQSAGITLIDKLAPYETNTYGVGEVIKHLILNEGVNKIYLGVGGSATIDLGVGMLEALGVKFYDGNNRLIKNVSQKDLRNIYHLDTTELYDLIKGIEFNVMSDVSSPILGDMGGLRVYTPQKGASIEDLDIMEENIKSFIKMVQKDINESFSDQEYLGAAGGINYSLKHFLNAHIKLGITALLEIINFKEKIKEYDIIISGEGKFDYQTLQGKVIKGIMEYNPKRLVIISAINELPNIDMEVYSIVPSIAGMDESLNHPHECLRKLIRNIEL